MLNYKKLKFWDFEHKVMFSFRVNVHKIVVMMFVSAGMLWHPIQRCAHPGQTAQQVYHQGHISRTHPLGCIDSEYLPLNSIFFFFFSSSSYNLQRALGAYREDELVCVCLAIMPMKATGFAVGVSRARPWTAPSSWLEQ